MGGFSFWVVSLAFPALLLVINSGVRWSVGMPQSAAGDLILLLAVFDGTVILQADDFKAFSELLTNANNLRAWFLLALVVNIILWAVAVLKIEHFMHHSADQPSTAPSVTTILAMMGYIALSLSAMVINIAPFTVRQSVW